MSQFVWRVCALGHDAKRIVIETPFTDVDEAVERKEELEALPFVAEAWLERAPLGDWERYV